MNKIALITIHLQNDIAQKNTERMQAVANIKTYFSQFLDQIRKMGVQIIHLQVKGEPLDLNQSGANINTDIISEFYNPSDIIVPKSKDSGFYQTDLQQILQDQNVDTIIMTGLELKICLQATAADAFNRGYKVIIPEEYIISANPEDRQRTINWMVGYCATAMTPTELFSIFNKDKNAVSPEAAISVGY